MSICQNDYIGSKFCIPTTLEELTTLGIVLAIGTGTALLLVVLCTAYNFFRTHSFREMCGNGEHEDLQQNAHPGLFC